MIFLGWHRHCWFSRTIIDDMGLVHPCQCATRRRLWNLVTLR